MADLPLKCVECHMVFKSPALLAKHQQKFCVGGKFGDPHDLQLRKGLKTDKKYTYKNKPIIPAARAVSPYEEPRRDAQMWLMAETYGKNMANLTAQSLDLERQKNDIRRRLMELNNEPSQTSRILNDLKQHEAKTQQTLEQLRTQLNGIEEKGKKKTLPLPVVYNTDNSLAGEIRALRQNYLHLGGNDPGILSQLADMISEAQTLDDKKKSDKPKPPTKVKPPTLFPETQAMELENARLQRELLLLQEKNVTDRLRYPQDHHHGELEKQVSKLELEHSRKMAELHLEIERLRQQGELEKYKRELAEDFARHSGHKVQPIQVVSPEKVPVQYVPQNPMGPVPYEVNPLGPASYDPHDYYGHPYPGCRGFVIFYDFVTGLLPRSLAARLVVGLYDSQARVGDAAILPPVDVEVSSLYRDHHYGNCGAVVGAKQPVPRCHVQGDLGIVVELQLTSPSAVTSERNSLVPQAWTKISVFNDYGQLTTGRFHIQFRVLPISPLLSFRDMETLPRFGDAQLYYRIAHARDVLTESRAPVGLQYAPSYRPAPVNWQSVSKVSTPPPPPSATPPSSPGTEAIPRPQRWTFISVSGVTTMCYPCHKWTLSEYLVSLPSATHVTSGYLYFCFHGSSPDRPSSSGRTIGFQVDRVKGAESGRGKVRLTAYHASSGKVVHSSTSPVTCGTTAVRSDFKHRYHVFGQQEATFADADLKGDVVLIARFYLIHEDYHDNTRASQFDDDKATGETLVAWAAMPLVTTNKPGSLTDRSRLSYDPSFPQVNTGTHSLRLYRPPVPSPGQVPRDSTLQLREWVRYWEATLRFHIFQEVARPGSLTPSEDSDEEEEGLPQDAWLPLDRKVSPSEPFTTGDGFDIYIDGGRFLPDSVTFSRVAGRIMDRAYTISGQDMVTGFKLDSDIYNPVYEHKEEIRDPDIPATATLVLKLYTMDNFYKELTCVGYSLLNIFVESGTERQPTVDSGVQVSLNEGAHQLRLYQRGPDGDEPVSERCLRESHTRYIPAASILVRLVKVVRGKNGRPLECSRVPESDWVRLGLWQPRPAYTDRIYYSEKCRPSRGETQLLCALARRPVVTMRQVVTRLALSRDISLDNDKSLAQYIRNQLTRVADSRPLDQDLTFISTYSPVHGLKVAVDGACNIPWSNFSEASVCLNPPGAFYMEAHLATYDKLTFVNDLELSSTTTAPVWMDGFKHFPNRSFHKYLTVIIHIQEVGVTLEKQNYKYGLLDQAWTAVQVFTDNYAVSSVFQLPLFRGAPKPEMLRQLAKEPCKDWLTRSVENKKIQLLEGASVFVRLCDGRRDEEFPENVPESGKLEINFDYIPPQLEESYNKRIDGKTLESLIPAGKNLRDFAKTLGVKFKSLIYKLYEEGNLTT
ncbi:uncharacterized protein LOC135470637 [Liolophura sinensis]|uniref:uncharacterized protein LOC135470637 n=1 Tax=Liolophura sinensis TaxID=3198878 RepID=UPI0031583391